MKFKYYFIVIAFSVLGLVCLPSTSYAEFDECEECQEGESDCPVPDGGDKMPIEIGE